jgi:lipoprotein-anchoring transpeptidase ErfK/SrfK
MQGTLRHSLFRILAPMSRPVAVTCCAVLVAAACSGSSPTPTPTPTPHRTSSPPPAYLRTIAEARHAALRVFRSPNGPTRAVLHNPTPDGAPRVMLVTKHGDRRPGWLHTLLPIRPNGSTGWVRRADVKTVVTGYRLDVFRHRHRLVVHDDGRVIRRITIAVGTSDTPTPGGEYYLVELVKQQDPNGIYGPYAYGLSGFSTVLHEFAGGPGEIGLHGTNEPWLIGHDVSHGCIRMHNRDIRFLVKRLPLGTPVVIHR